MQPIMENLRQSCKAAKLILVHRLKLKLPMNELSCSNQSAYMSVINRRKCYSLFSFLQVRKLMRKKEDKEMLALQ